MAKSPDILPLLKNQEIFNFEIVVNLWKYSCEFFHETNGGEKIHCALLSFSPFATKAGGRRKPFDFFFEPSCSQEGTD